MSDSDWTVSSNQNWCSVSPQSGNGNGDVTITVSTNTDTQNDRSATITLSNVSLNSVTITVTQNKAEEPGSSYTVGLISDMHYCITDNKKIVTEKAGNDPGDYGSDSFFRQDLAKLIDRFKQAGVEFVASCGDVVSYDINDLVEFTHDYINDWTGIDTYSGTSFLSNANYRPLYCAMGNHDHYAVYSNASYCKYINYGNSSDHQGTRWKTITYNGTTYNCPEQLAGNNVTYASSDSKSYYVIPSGHPNDMFIFLSAFYGDRLPSASNPNYGDRNDMSQLHPHNQLDSSDSNVQAMMQYCGKTSIFTSGNETNMNFQYYKPSDLIWLKNTIQANSSKRIFVFSHYFFPHKAGGGNKYEVGSTELNGLTFHFLNKLNNEYPRTIWFSGHSHFSWKDITANNTGDIHYCNKDYQYITPDATDNSQILSNFTSSNFYVAPSGKKLYNRADSASITDDATGWNVHLPSMSRPKESSSVMANCEGAIIEIHDDYAEIYKLGYSTSDGNTYTSYSSSIYYRSLIVQNADGSGTISGPVPSSGGDDPTPGNNQIAFVIRNDLGSTVYFTGRMRVYVGDSSSASIDADTCSAYDFCFRNPRYYSTSGSKYFYNNVKQSDGTHVYTPANKYGYGDNTESLAPGESMYMIYTKTIDYSSSQGTLKLTGDVSALFGKYFVVKDHSSYDPVSSPFYNTSIKLDVAINRSTSSTPNRIDQAASFYHVRFENNSSNQKITNQGVYHMVIDQLVTGAGWTASDHPSHTSSDVISTSYVTVEPS